MAYADYSDIDRGARCPRSVEYPVIDLLLDGFIHATGLEDLDPTKFPGRSLIISRK